jgi:hypothetical protein
MTKQCWNFVIYRVPSQPSTLRVYVWRKLKGWGGLYLQQSVCVLPQRDELHQRVEALKGEIHDNNGEVDVFTVWIEDPQQNALLVQRFQQQADVEYQELLGRCRDFHSELAAERAKGNLTFAELDENEAELTKLRSWLAKIGERDWFDAPRAISAGEALEQCVQDFQRFSEEVYTAQGV